jgi:hypothetical protein
MRKRKPKVFSDIEPADDVQEIAGELIAKHFPGLKDARIEYLYVVRTNEDGEIVPPRVQDVTNLGKAQVASAVDQKVRHLHFRIVMNRNWWEDSKTTPEQRRASIYHQLCHFWLVVGKPKMARHDFEGFLSELEHMGPWHTTLRAADEALHPTQESLPLEA